jgi:type II secretion system protein N
VTDSNPSPAQAGRATLPTLIALPLALILVAVFIVLLFPWDSVARRISYEIESASGSQVSMRTLSPALSARGLVLVARDVVVLHRAVKRVRIDRLEIAPRWSQSWLSGDPTMRIWADTELALIDGVLRLGDSPGFTGRVDQVEIEALPLRLEASGASLAGTLSAIVDVTLDPRGILTGRAEFESESLVIHSDLLPAAIVLTHAAGAIEILDSGATHIESLVFEGELIEGEIDGEVSMTHHSQSPPIDLTARIRIIPRFLRELAPNAGIDISESGEVAIRIRGTLDRPLIEPLSSRGKPASRSDLKGRSIR